MRRWETLLSLLAVVLASVAAAPIRSRLLFAFAAVALLIVAGVSRMRAAMTRGAQAPSAFDPGERARRLREERDRRYER